MPWETLFRLRFFAARVNGKIGMLSSFCCFHGGLDVFLHLSGNIFLIIICVVTLPLLLFFLLAAINPFVLQRVQVL